jgi:transposase
MDSSKLVFVDESAAKTNMVRLRGRSKGGQRCYCFAPSGHWQTTTMISSVRLDGTTACMAIEGGTSSEVFREYVRQVLVPSLKLGDVVITDNLRAHKDKEAKEAIEEVGAQIEFLPAYSPDLNPIEKMWSKVKEKLRSIGARTYDSLVTAIGQALDSVTKKDANGWFNSCGYVTNKL